MSNVKKLMMSTAGGGGPFVGDVFRTYVYKGNSSTQTINNGIDFTGEGGLAWFKCRNVAMNHNLFDTVRGNTELLKSNTNSEESTQATGRYPTFTSTGFTLGNDTGGEINYSNRTYVSWSFRKAPKFFDIVTWTGNATNGRQIAHNLGSVPGMIIVKRLDTTGHWPTYHRGIPTKYVQLNLDNGWSDGQYRFGDYTNPIAPTSTHFTISSYSDVNASGGSFVAYVFAHNDNDGGFGPDGTQDIIKCGTYTGSGDNNGPFVDLGFRPQWIMIKRADTSSSPWYMFDRYRGIRNTDDTGPQPPYFNDPFLRANESLAEIEDDYISTTPKGFAVRDNLAAINGSNGTFIYVAISEDLREPESATDVFQLVNQVPASNQNITHGISGGADFVMIRYNGSSSETIWADRFGGEDAFYKMNSSAARITYSSSVDLTETPETIFKDGVTASYYGWSNSYPCTFHFLKRAKGFFDVVHYMGNSTINRAIDHSLGVTPECYFIKRRRSTYDWDFYHPNLITNSRAVIPNSITTYSHTWTGFTTSNINENTFNVSSNMFGGVGATNQNNYQYVAYLFASYPGVSKVGSYTGNGSSQTIDCGFSTGARWILIKRIDATGSWFSFNTENGINASNDTVTEWSGTSAANNSIDLVDPHNSGFIVQTDGSNTSVNATNGKYIFIAIA